MLQILPIRFCGTMPTDDDDKVRTLQAILPDVSTARAFELLEATNQSVERAVDVYFMTGSSETTRGLMTCEDSRLAAGAGIESASLNNRGTKNPAAKRKAEKPSKKPAYKGPSTPTSMQGKKQRRQGTLDRFLGISSADTKREGSPQKRIDNFFSPAQEPVEMEFDAESKTTDTAAAVQVKEPSETIETVNVAAAEDDHGISSAEIPSGRSVLFYSTLAETYETISSTTKRTIKLEALKKLFVRSIQAVGGIHPSVAGGITDEIDRTKDALILACVIDMTAGKMSPTVSSGEPSYVASEPLQVSGSAISSAVQAVTLVSKQAMRNAYRTTGDLGDVAAQFYSPASSIKKFFASTSADQEKKSGSLTVLQIQKGLQKIAYVAAGTGSQKERQQNLVQLLRAAKSKAEIRFLVRLLLSNMRLGASMKTIVSALASAAEELYPTVKNIGDGTTNPGDLLQSVFNICPNGSFRIARALLVGGIQYAVDHCTIQIGWPVLPMLGNPAHSIEQVEKFLKPGGSSKQAVAEWKYDGVRCQAHFDGTTTRLFSRKMVECTSQYPDVVKHLKCAKKDDVTSFVIDGEIVACRKTVEGYNLLPFQELMTRDNEQTELRRIIVFDLLLINGHSMMASPLFERQSVLQRSFDNSGVDGFSFVKSIPISVFNEELIEKTLNQSVQEGAEGLMIKLIGRADDDSGKSGYESGTRSHGWLKVKKDYVSGETIDVVPIGAWYGNGRKAISGFLSPVLLAVYDDQQDCFRSIARCMSFSDSMYRYVKVGNLLRNTEISSKLVLLFLEKCYERVLLSWNPIPIGRRGR